MIQIKALQYNNLTVDVFYHYLLQKRSALAVCFKAFFFPPPFLCPMCYKQINHASFADGLKNTALLFKTALYKM